MIPDILGQVDDEFSLLDEEGPSVDTELAKKIENVFFESSGDNIRLQKIMKEQKHPANLLSLKPPSINPQIDSSQQYTFSEFMKPNCKWDKLKFTDFQ